jgi:putative DNA primase/helicase
MSKTIAEHNARASVLDRLNPALLSGLDADIAWHQASLQASPKKLAGGFADPMAGVVAWPKLEAIPEEAATTPDAFPFHALGPIMGNAARAIAQDVQAPDSLAGGSVLAAASLAVQPLANVILPHGQRSPLSVFVITGAGSGDRKSAVDGVACKEIEEVRKNQARDYLNLVKRYDADMGARNKKDPEPPKPMPQSLTTGNATIEGLSRLLKNQSSVGIFSAEGGEMLGGHSLRDDKRSSGLAFYLKGWSGESLDSLRGGEGLTVLLGRRMAMHVLVQPVLLGALLGDPLAQGQGLLARCLIAQPDTLAGTREYQHVDPDKNPAVVAYNRAIKSLLETSPTLWEGGDGYELKPQDLHLTDEARALWIAFYNEIERQQGNGSELEGARPFASKAAEHAARIAGIITLVEEPMASAVPGYAMDAAIELTGFYLTEHLRLTGAGRQERVDGRLRALLAWIQSAGTLVPKKDVLQKSPRSLGRTAAALNPLLEELTRRGYIREAGKSWEVRNV